MQTNDTPAFTVRTADVHWTHSNVVAYGVGEDALHNRENTMVFLGDMQVAIKTYQASESAFKNTGPTGFNALGGRIGVLLTHLRLQKENLPDVVPIDQIKSLFNEKEILCAYIRLSIDETTIIKEKKLRLEISKLF